jgi:hypothetical protein
VRIVGIDWVGISMPWLPFESATQSRSTNIAPDDRYQPRELAVVLSRATHRIHSTGTFDPAP